MDVAPFRQMRFEDVPERPRVPHPYFESRAHTVELRSRPFGAVRVHVREHGAGPPLLLVHGLMTTSYSWRYALRPLGERFTCWAPDLVGAGRSDKPDAGYGPDALAESIGEVAAALGIHGAPIVGNSLGGYLAMRLVLRDPGAASRLLVVHAPGLPAPRMTALRVALDVLPGIRRAVDARIARDPDRWVHRNVHYWDETLKSREEHREYAAPLRTPEGRRAFLRMMDETLDVRAMRSFEAALRDRGGRFPIPLALLYAARDPIVPPSVGDRLHALLPEARFARVERASHFMHVDAVDEFARHALDFLCA